MALAGLAARLLYVAVFQDPPPLHGDARYYHLAANLLAEGKGLLHPVILELTDQATPSAAHPPGYIAFLAIPSLLGLRSATAHQLWSCALGAATVVAVAYGGRAMAGRRVGLVAAVIAVAYPNLWLIDGSVMSETLVVFLSAMTVLAAYCFRREPTTGRAVALGLTVAAIALTRAELVLLVPVLVLPWLRHGRPRLATAAGCLLAVVVPVGLYSAYNTSRFDRPVLVTTGLGPLLVTTNCGVTYAGELVGSWSFSCWGQLPPVPGDASNIDVAARRAGLRYARRHLSRVPIVVAAREGRVWGLFRPLQQVRLDSRESSRTLGVAYAGLGAYYLLLPLAVAGAVTLRRRRVPLLPLLGLVGCVAAAAAIGFGQTRYRAAAEVPIVLLAAVGIVRCAELPRHANRPQ